MTHPLRGAALALLAFACVCCGDPPPQSMEVRGAVAPPPDTAASLTIRLLDVTDSRIGGLAVLVSDSAGGVAKHVLVDGGERPNTVAAALRRLGVRDLALVVLTHAHSDHFGGLRRVLQEFPVAAFAYNGDSRALASYRRLLSAVDSSGARPIIVDRAVRTVTLAVATDTTVIRLLPPPSGTRMRGDPINNRSVGVLVRYGRFSALIPGDAELAEEHAWGKRYAGALDVDLLVASHHGSRDANSTARSGDWYRIVTPRLLFVSANGRQHPFREVLDYAKAEGIPSYCTANHGSVAVRVSRAGRWTVRTERTGVCAPGAELVGSPRTTSLP
jgi:competence protein ComEC